MSQQTLLIRIVEALASAGIPFMLTGSIVSSLQGMPRASQDVDFVIDIAASDARRIAGVLAAPDIFVDEEAVADAARRRSMFNVIAPSSGGKADFWLLKTRS